MTHKKRIAVLWGAIHIAFLMQMMPISPRSSVCCAQQSDNYRNKLRNRFVTIDETNLPIVFINVDGRMIQQDDYVLGQMTILHNGDGQTNYGDTITHPDQNIDYKGFIALKYRGNTSFNTSDKKPYAFRTLAGALLPDEGGKKQKVSLLGMAKDNKWGFIAPWSDETMFRDILSFELARPWMPWVPDARLCEVILDGTYYGVYLLCERVSKGKNRLDLNDPYIDENGTLVADWHVSVDHGYDPYFTSKYHPWQSLDGTRKSNYTVCYEYGDPDDDEFDQLPLGTRQALHTDIDRMEDAFMASNWQDSTQGYRQFIDVQTFIDYMLATELSMNIDGYRLSTHLYRHSDTRAKVEGIDPRWKLTLWDYNIAWGNANYYDGDRTDTWQYLMNINFSWDSNAVPFYWYRLLQDSTYVNDMKKRWQQYRNGNHSNRRLMATIDSLALLVTSGGAAARNESAWGIFTKSDIWPLPYYATDYDDAVDYLKRWTSARLRFLDSQLLPPRIIDTSPVDIASGFNADIVAEQLPADNHTTAAIDGSDRVFYAASLKRNGGLPVNRLITSAYDKVNYQLEPYDAENALNLRSQGDNGTIEFQQPLYTSEVFILGTSGNGDSRLTLTLNYDDGGDSETTFIDIRDWSVRQPRGTEAVTSLGNITRGSNYFTTDNHYCLFDNSVPADPERPLVSITFTNNSWAYASVMAVSYTVGESSSRISPVAHTLPACRSGIYDLQGRNTANSAVGRLNSQIRIVRQSDGTVRKIIVK